MTEPMHDPILDYARQSEQPEHKGNGHAKGGRFVLKRFDDILLSTTPNYCVKGIVPRTGLVVVWGPPKCGKSFWCFDLTMHIALGWRYRGRRVQQGPVVYLALEGGHGFTARVEAWRRRHLADLNARRSENVGSVPFMITLAMKDELRARGLAEEQIAELTPQQAHEILGDQKEDDLGGSNNHHQPVPFFLLDVPVDLVADRGALIASIHEQLAGEMPVAVVIDTLNRALLGDENKSDDMAKFIRAADGIRTAFGCVVIIVHHCGIAGSRPRGHTSLSGADDAQIAIERDEAGNITITVEHMKDADAGAPMGSKLERVELGQDDDGDPMTSCVIIEAPIVIPTPPLPPGAKLALDQLRELVAEEGELAPASNHIPVGVRVVSAIVWRECFYKAQPEIKQTARQRAFVRACTRLQELHLIGIWSDKVWLTGQPGQARTSQDNG